MDLCMRKLLIIYILMGWSVLVCASPVSLERARLAADRFLQSRSVAEPSIRKAPRRTAQTVSLVPDQQFYVFETDGGGFVMIAADDCARPVLAYGDKAPWTAGGPVSRKEIPLNLRTWLEGYNASIKAAVRDGYTPPRSVQQEWSGLQNGSALAATPVVARLISTEWDQTQEYINVENTYNYYTPASVYTYEGVDYPMNTPTGCVATSMAQVMKYWEWPVKGTGTHSYTPYRHPEYGVLSADFENTAYNWRRMPDKLTYESSSYTQIKAVALLMYHCGVATNMDYDIKGSGTQTVMEYKAEGYSPAEHALCTYFGYSNNLESYMRVDFDNADDWMDLLKDELNAARPVMYAGGAHSFICCGYDTEDRFYFNFGWGGNYDGFYAVDAIRPGGSGTGGNSSDDYSYNADIIVGIQPAADSYEQAYDHALRLYHEDKRDYSPTLDKDSLWYMYDTLHAHLWIVNYDTLDYNGEVAVQALDSAGRLVACSRAFPFSVQAWNAEEVDVELLQSLSLTPGVYHLQPVFLNNAGGWTTLEARHYWSKLKFTVYHWSNVFTYSEIDINPNPLKTTQSATVTVAIANLSSQAFDKTVYASLYTYGGVWMQDIEGIDMSEDPLESGYYSTYAFSGNVFAPVGEYVLVINYLSGDYRYMVGSDCYEAAVRVRVEEDGTLRVSDIAEDKVVVYPNPVHDRLFVEGTEVQQWTLYNLTGQLIRDQKTNGERALYMGNMPAGEYILRISNNKGQVSSHRIIKH